MWRLTLMRAPEPKLITLNHTDFVSERVTEQTQSKCGKEIKLFYAKRCKEGKGQQKKMEGMEICLHILKVFIGGMARDMERRKESWPQSSFIWCYAAWRQSWWKSSSSEKSGHWQDDAHLCPTARWSFTHHLGERQIKLWSHRAWTGRLLKDHLVPAPWHGQGHLALDQIS